MDIGEYVLTYSLLLVMKILPLKSMKGLEKGIHIEQKTLWVGMGSPFLNCVVSIWALHEWLGILFSPRLP